MSQRITTLAMAMATRGVMIARGGEAHGRTASASNVPSILSSPALWKVERRRKIQRCFASSAPPSIAADSERNSDEPKRLTITAPDDWHLHVRDGDVSSMTERRLSPSNDSPVLPLDYQSFRADLDCPSSRWWLRDWPGRSRVPRPTGAGRCGSTHRLPLREVDHHAQPDSPGHRH